MHRPYPKTKLKTNNMLGCYIDQSTRTEIEFAKKNGNEIYYLEP